MQITIAQAPHMQQQKKKPYHKSGMDSTVSTIKVANSVQKLQMSVGRDRRIKECTKISQTYMNLLMLNLKAIKNVHESIKLIPKI